MFNWNRKFTDLLRNDRPTLWGNWSLNPAITPGAVGIMDSATGNFTPISSIPGGSSFSKEENPKWEVKSSDTEVSQTNINLSGAGTEPESQTEIKAGLQVSYQFGSAGSLISSFAVSEESYLEDFTSLFRSQMTWLRQQATNAGMGTNAGITQGFCVVTHVIYADSGLNVGANVSGSTFSISGSAKAINSMLGAEAEVDGSFVSTSQSSSMDSHIWPAAPNTVSSGKVPIAFTVASFDGDMIIPNWTRSVNRYFILNFNNIPGTTWIARGNLSYTLNGNLVNRDRIEVSGGISTAIGDIPLTATNLRLEVTFVASSVRLVFQWSNPMVQWQSGSRNIDIRGVAPNTPNVTDREA